VWKEYEKGNANGHIGCQLIFSDIGTPGPDKDFTIYDYLKETLIQYGIPAEEIAFIHDAKTDAQRDALFKEMRTGKKKVLIGSTDKCGTGVNDMDFNKEYCKQVFEMIDNNPKFWSSITNKGSYCIIFEQHMLANVAEDMKIPITYLSNPFDYKELEKIGYTHIWGGKKEQMWYDKIKDMIKSYYPKEYKLINEIIPE
jgi:hypothetical protein